MDFNDGINGVICRLGVSGMLEEMVIALDPADIRKKLDRKFT